MRRIERRGRQLFLDGEPLRIAGVLDQGFWPGGVYTAPSDEALRADVETAKGLGFNLVRKHVKVEDPRWYAWCDRLGMLVAQDMPSSHDLSTERAREGFLREWLEIVDTAARHPCIVMWIPFNEHWGEPPPDFQREVVRATRAADPTRLVVDASGWNQLDDTDLVDVHDYGAELTEHFAARATTGRSGSGSAAASRCRSRVTPTSRTATWRARTSWSTAIAPWSSRFPTTSRASYGRS